MTEVSVIYVTKASVNERNFRARLLPELFRTFTESRSQAQLTGREQRCAENFNK